MSLIRLETWENKRYGRIFRVNDDNYSWRFEEVINGNAAGEEDVARLFVGYCINNQPTGIGDIYTPFFEKYYIERLQRYQNNHINDIELVMNQSRLESLFAKEHIIEEQNGYNNSKHLFEFINKSEAQRYENLYKAYMQWLRNKSNNTEPEETDKKLIDKDKLQTLFTKAFFNKDYDIQETSKASIQLSRFDVLCQRLEMVKFDTDKKPTQKMIGEIAQLIYESQYTKTDYRKPNRKGQRGKFAPLLNTIFEVVGMDKPSDCRPNKYKPDEYINSLFENVLKK